MRLLSVRDGQRCEPPDLKDLRKLNDDRFYKDLLEVVKCTTCIVAFSRTLNKIDKPSQELQEAREVMMEYKDFIIVSYKSSAESRIEVSSADASSLARLIELLKKTLVKLEELARDWDQQQTSKLMSVRTPWEALCRVLFLAEKQTSDLSILSDLQRTWEPFAKQLDEDLELITAIREKSAKDLGSGQPRLMHVKLATIEGESVLITGFSSDQWTSRNRILFHWARKKRIDLLKGKTLSDIQGRRSNAIRYLKEEQRQMNQADTTEEVDNRRRVILRCREEHGKEQEEPSSAARDFPGFEERNRCTVCLATNVFRTVKEPSLEGCLELEINNGYRFGSDISCAEVETEVAQARLTEKEVSSLRPDLFGSEGQLSLEASG